MEGYAKLLWIAMGFGGLVAIWQTADVLRGESGPEELVFTIPILVAPLGAGVLRLRHRWLGGTTPAAPALDAATVARRVRQLRRVALLRRADG